MEISKDVIGVEPGQVMVTMTQEDIRMVQSAINEALEIVDENEFQTRTGYSRSEMRALWAQLDVIAERHPE